MGLRGTVARALAIAMASLGLAAGGVLAQETPPPSAAPTPPIQPAPPIGGRLTFGFLIAPGPPVSVRQVIPRSPAARAGLRAGDVLISVDGRPATVASIREAGRRAGPGQEVKFRIRRGEREEVVAVVPEVRPRTAVTPRDRRREPIVLIDPDSLKALVELYLDGAREAFELHGGLDLNLDLDLDLDDETVVLGPFHRDSLRKTLGRIEIEIPELDAGLGAFGLLPGARLAVLEPDLARYFPGVEHGLLVVSVRPGTRAAEAGLQAGDVLVEVDRVPVEDLGALRRALRSGGSHALDVVRHGERRTFQLSR